MDSTDAGQSQRQRRAARRRAGRRQRILDAARRVMVTEGLFALTVARVARAADVSKPAVYYYFASKDELVAALAVHLMQREMLVVTRAIEAAESGVDALLATVRARVDLYTRDPDAFRIIYVWRQLFGITPRAARRDAYTMSERVTTALENKLLRDKRAGKLREDAHPRRLANMAWVMAHGLLSLTTSLAAAGGALRYTVDELTEDACAILRSAARGS